MAARPAASPDLESKDNGPKPPTGPRKDVVPPLNMKFVHVPERPSTTRARRVRSGGSARSSASPSTPSQFPALSLRSFSARSTRSAAKDLPPRGNDKSAFATAEAASQPEPPPTSGSQHSGGPDGVSWTAEGDREPRTSHRAAPSIVSMAHLGRESAPKPALLTRLEEHVQRELSFLNPNDDAAVLRIHREALNTLADNFKIYGPTLQQALAAYDRILQKYSTINSDAQRLEEQLASKDREHREEMRQMMQRITDSEKAHEEALKEHRLLTEGTTTSSLTAKEERESMISEIETLRDEKKGDLVKTLTLVKAVRESDLRIRTLNHRLQQANQEVEEKHKLREMLQESQVEITQLKKAFERNVPLRVHEEEVRGLKKAIDETEKDLRRVRRVAATRNSQLIGVNKIVDQLRDEQRFTKARKRRPTTPRPEWEVVYERLPYLQDIMQPIDNIPSSGSDNDEEVAEGVNGSLKGFDNNMISPRADNGVSPRRPRPAEVPTTSCHHVDALVDRIEELQITLGVLTEENEALRSLAGRVRTEPLFHPDDPVLGPDDEPVTNQILARGTGNAVPVYLRMEGMVTVFALALSELQQLAERFFRHLRTWIEDDAKQSTSNKAPDVAIAFSSFLRKEVGTKGSPFEGGSPHSLAYSITEAVVAHGADPIVNCFSKILDGSIPPRIAIDALTILDQLAQEVRRLADAQHRRHVRKGVLMEVMGPLLSFKAKPQLDELKVALGVETQIDTERLVDPTHPFMRVLFAQACYDGPAFYTQIVKDICALDSEGGIEKRALLRVLLLIEPRVPHPIQTQFLSGPNGEYIDDGECIPVHTALRRLAAMPIVRITPPKKPPPPLKTGMKPSFSTLNHGGSSYVVSPTTGEPLSMSQVVPNMAQSINI